LFFAEFILRTRKAANQLELDIRFGRFIQVHEMRSALLPHPHEALVLDDASKPRWKGAVSPILHEVLKRLPKGILHLVFGVASIPEHQDRSLQAHVIVTAHQFSERVRIAAKRSVNQLVI
jgi:hypothetical protein